jgi:hypothetical protein
LQQTLAESLLTTFDGTQDFRRSASLPLVGEAARGEGGRYLSRARNREKTGQLIAVLSRNVDQISTTFLMDAC